MEPSYSVMADGLSKFQSASAPIQALWLLAGTVTLLGMTWIVMRGLRDIAVVLHGDNGRAQLPGGLAEDGNGRLAECFLPIMPGLDPGIHALTGAKAGRRREP